MGTNLILKKGKHSIDMGRKNNYNDSIEFLDDLITRAESHIISLVGYEPKDLDEFYEQRLQLENEFESLEETIEARRMQRHIDSLIEDGYKEVTE